MRLPRGSIRTFKDLATAFFSRYDTMRPPRVTCDVLIGMKQERGESTRKFIARFTQAMRGIQNCNDELALAAARKGLQKGGPGTLRYDSYKREFQNFQEFLTFAEGYMRADEDAGSPEKSRSRSPRQRNNWRPQGDKSHKEESSREYNQPRRGDRLNKFRGRRDRKEDRREEHYRPHFTSYAELTKPRYELFSIIKNNFELPEPLNMELFEVKDGKKWCEFHRSRGHSTGDCLQLKHILEKLARQGDLTRYITEEFYKQHASRYNGKERKFRTEILPRREQKEDRYLEKRTSEEARVPPELPQGRPKPPLFM